METSVNLYRQIGKFPIVRAGRDRNFEFGQQNVYQL